MKYLSVCSGIEAATSARPDGVNCASFDGCGSDTAPAVGRGVRTLFDVAIINLDEMRVSSVVAFSESFASAQWIQGICNGEENMMPNHRAIVTEANRFQPTTHIPFIEQ